LAHDDTPEPGKRDFLYVATAAVGVVAVGAVAWPIINQMNPDASVLALASAEFDLSHIDEGSTVTVKWRGLPVFIRHRTQKNIDDARAVPLGDLKDPETDEARVMKGHDQWLVMIANCTHLGCIPNGDQGEFGGWLCPCHGSQYDTSGRIRKGPAPKNLVIPPYKFLSDTKIQIG
jgi:ubiquinol-cytochrome c reductase iron-sulfur subunit